MRRLFVTFVAAFCVLGSVVAAGAAPSDAGLNARMIRWQEQQATIHLIVYADDGRLGTTATVPEGKPLLFGFEWVDSDLTSLTTFLAGATVELSVDGGPYFDVSHGYLDTFYSDGKGPRWTWDHDADGKRDRDGDGIGDGWVGLYVGPFRYRHPGMSAGTHTFDFRLDHTDWTEPFPDHVTIDVVP